MSLPADQYYNLVAFTTHATLELLPTLVLRVPPDTHSVRVKTAENEEAKSVRNYKC